MERATTASGAETKFDIGACHSCHEKHEGLHLKAFAEERKPWTHWYLCPMTGDPVPLSMVTVQGADYEYSNKIMRDLEKAYQTGHYVVAIFRQVNDRIILDRHQVEFVNGKLIDCVSLLRENVEKQLGMLPAPKEPLPFAKRHALAHGISLDEQVAGVAVADMAGKAADAAVGPEDDDDDDCEDDDPESVASSH